MTMICCHEELKEVNRELYSLRMMYQPDLVVVSRELSCDCM